MAPIVNGIEQSYQDRIAVKRINADEGNGPAIMRQYRVPGHPTLLVFDQEAEEFKRFVGPHPTETITIELDKLLGK